MRRRMRAICSRARLDQIINLKHELVQLAGKLDWEWLDGGIAPLYSDKGRPGIKTRFVIGLLLLKHIFALSDEEVCERWVYDPYFQYFTGEEFFQHAFPHDRSDLSHGRKRLGDKLELLLAESLRVAHEAGALRTNDLKRVTADTTVQPAAPARLEALFLPRSRGRVHRQRQGQRPLRVRRQGLDRHHQRPRPGRSVRAVRQGAAGKPLRWPHARRRHRSHRKAHRT